MLMSVFVLAILIGENFATGPLASRLKPSNEVEVEAPSKKHLFQWKDMVEHTTGRNAIDYIDYGCWCHPAGKGKVLDGVDRCCKKHGRCYRRILKNKRCPMWPPIFLIKYLTGEGNRITCAPRKSYKKRMDAKCKYPLCMCDLRAALCLGKEKFNDKFQNYDLNSCQEKKRE